MTGSAQWRLRRDAGDAGAFHGREVPADLGPSVWWFEVDRSALALGSGQNPDHIDLDACRHYDIDVVRRRSGGGAVLLQPGDAIWVDVLLPRQHPRFTDDVGSSAWWLGEAWSQTLSGLGVEDTTVHRGPMIATRWSKQLCFAGVGSGEVIVGRGLGARTGKIVGISQRRTRWGARFQCVLYRHWRPELHAALFADPALRPGEIERLATTVDVAPEDVVQGLLANLPLAE